MQQNTGQKDSVEQDEIDLTAETAAHEGRRTRPVDGPRRRRWPPVVRFGLLLALIGLAGVSLCWWRYDADTRSNASRRETIESFSEPERGLVYAAGVSEHPAGMWQGMSVAFGAVALVGLGVIVAWWGTPWGSPSGPRPPRTPKELPTSDR